MARQRNPCRGERFWSAVLNEDEVREIRRRYSTENVSQYELAAEYGVVQTTISAVVRRVNWKGVTDQTPRKL